MPDKEKVIKGLNHCFHGQEFCDEIECPYYIEQNSCYLEECQGNLKEDVLSMLKEQEDTINELQNAYEYLQKQFFEVQDKLLKEQEAVEPRRDANCVRMFRCGACGEYVGFIDSDPGDHNEQDNYCRNCGRKVKRNE